MSGGTKVCKIVAQVELDIPSSVQDLTDIAKEVESFYPVIRTPDTTHRILIPRFDLEKTSQSRIHKILSSQIESWSRGLNGQNRKGVESEIKQNIVAYHTVKLAGYLIQQLVQAQETGDLYSTPLNHLWNLYMNPEKEKVVRDFCLQAFPDLYFLVDPMTGRYRIKMSYENPESVNLNIRESQAREFYNNAKPIEDFGTGVQLFVGLAAAIIGLNQKFILLDDPAVFLHPPLARLFGKMMTQTAKARSGQLFVSTHSAEFLYGCIEESDDITVVRFTYDSKNDLGTTRKVDKADLKELTKNALLKSAEVYRALFHKGAIITEGHPDRVFYDAVNQILLETGEGVSDTQFISTQGGGIADKIIGPLRRVGIPAVAIVDFDVAFDGKASLEKLMTACQIPSSILTNMNATRSKLQTEWHKIGRKDMKIKGLTSIIDVKTNTETSQYLQQLSQYGLNIVPTGVLESWFREFQINRADYDGVRDFLTGVENGTITTRIGGVWDFMRSIKKWIENPGRLGIK
ncbi:MAG: AAA family ATPase [Candidatus Sifarchaeia archaeon]